MGHKIINYWSNPDEEWNGEPMGIAHEIQPTTADGQEMIRTAVVTETNPNTGSGTELGVSGFMKMTRSIC